MAVCPVAWDNIKLLEQNRQDLIKMLGEFMRACEVRYELSSDRLEAELADGHIRETAEICEWMIATRMHRALTND